MKLALAVVVVLLLLLLAEGAAAQFTMQFSGDIVIPRDTIHQGTAMTMNATLPAPPQIPAPPQAPASPTVPPPPSVAPLPPLIPAPSRPWDGMWYPWWSRFVRAVATMTLVGLVVLAAVVTAVFPRQIRRVASSLADSPGEALLAGIAVWILLPPLAVVLALSIVGVPAAVALPFLVAIVGLVGVAGVDMLIGERIVGAFERERSDALDAVVGAALLGVLAFLPGIGWFAILVAVTWGLGAVILLLLHRVRERPPTAPA